MKQSLLRELRHLCPERPLRYAEAMVIAELQATRLLKRRGVASPPVPDEIVTTFPRVQVEHVQPLGVSGATAWSGGRWLVLLNASEPAVRQRFSAFHELKHAIDGPIAEIAYPARPGMSAEEYREAVANRFAACALMPRVWIKRAWFGSIQDIAALARLFGVSRDAMSYRLKTLGLIEPRTRCEVAA